MYIYMFKQKNVLGGSVGNELILVQVGNKPLFQTMMTQITDA